jgi:uncharacterized membrane protein
MSVFDSIAGLPLHPLVVHAVVVLLPLTALATIAVALRRSWRPAAGPVAIAAAAMVVVSFVAKESGEALQRSRSALMANGQLVAEDHGAKGSLVPLVALALLVAAALVWFAGRRPALNVPAIVLAVVVGLGTIAWCVVVGDSGARSVWGTSTAASSGS